MKSVTIRQLHETTGKLVREARNAPIIVTDRGVRVAMLKRFSPGELAGSPFPVRDPKRLPRAGKDSTRFVSDDRSSR